MENTEYDMYDYWSGTGFLEFVVSTNNKYEFDFILIDYSGCMNGLDEMIGIHWAIEEGVLGLPLNQLKEGYRYRYSNISAHWFKSGSEFGEDDVDYIVGKITKHFNPFTWLSVKISNLYWYNLGWRLRSLAHKIKTLSKR